MATSNVIPEYPFRIYQFLPKDNNIGKVDIYGYPGDIDYKKGLTIRLKRKDTFYKGFLIETVYYEKYNKETKEYENQILRVEADYHYENGIIEYRDKNWYYMDEEDTEYWVKGNDRKYYTSATSKRKAGQRRRENVLNDIEMTVVYMLVMSDAFADTVQARNAGVEFLKKYRDERQLYISDNTSEFAQAIINDDEFAWIDSVIAPPDVTMRQWVLDALSYEDEPPNDGGVV